MTDKQIIIDDIDVSGCEFLRNCIIPDNYGCKIDDSLCCDVGNCYYKQLKRKEQECEELKENLPNAITRLMGELDQLKEQLKAKEQECEELKKTVDDLLHKPEIQDKILWKIDNEALLSSKDAWIYKLEQTLTEIKEIARVGAFYWKHYKEESKRYNEILQKISEVLE